MDTRLTADGTVVQRIQIIGTPIVVFSAWRPVNGGLSTGCEMFTSLTTFDDQWFGQVGHQRLPAELDALPAYSDERAIAVHSWHERLYQWAYEEIMSAFPDAGDPDGRRDMGEIFIVRH